MIHSHVLNVQVVPVLLSHLWEIHLKEGFFIVRITKQEAVELQKLGYKFGSEGTLHHTYTKHKRYFLTESKRALYDLEKIRKSKVVMR